MDLWPVAFDALMTLFSFSHLSYLLLGVFVGLIVGIDRFMSEARALTNFAGNAVATVIIGRWVGELDADQAERVLSGDDPFDEATTMGPLISAAQRVST